MKVKLLLLFIVLSTTALLAQNRTVNGTVIYEEDGEPIIGATVHVKGTSIGTATDLDGNFSVSIPDRPATLVVSYVGMVTKELPAEADMRIALSPEASTQLTEVVVDGYRKIDRRLFTGSADKISADDAKLEGVSDVSRMLQGRVAGVTVQNVSGTFGAAPKMKVRGATSIYGNQSPLWVVDGVVLEDVVEVSADQLSSGNAATLISSAVAGLNVDDIESFQILKDVSATALYGSRAMNGVIVVTTKRGREGQTSVNYTGEFTMRLKPSYYDYNLMNSQEQMDVYQEMERVGWFPMSSMLRQSSSGIYGYMYSAINTINPATGDFYLRNLPEDRAKYLQAAEMRNTNWFDELFRNSIIQSHSVSVSSGTKNSRSYGSLSLYNDPGWTESNEAQRFTANFNHSIDISQNVTLTILSKGALRKQKAPGTLQRKANVVEGEISRDFDINPFSYALNTSRTNDPDIFYRMNYAPFNINHELKNNYMDVDQMDLNIQAELEWKPIKGLDINVLAAYRHNKSTTASKIKDTSNMALAYRAAETSTVAQDNQFLYNDPDNLMDWPQVVLPEGGFYNREDFYMNSFNVRGTANYNKTFNDTHLTNFLFGMEARSADREQSQFSGYGYQWGVAGIPYTDYRILKMMLEGGFDYYSYIETSDRAAAFFGTASYSYMGKYTINGAFRYDGSNQLGKNAKNRWLPTWNVSGAWNAHEEDFLKTSKLISRLQVRATYGMNAAPAPSLANALLTLRSQVPFRDNDSNKELQIYLSSLENRNLTWEKQHEFNFGFDVGILRNRFSLSFDAYNRNIYDLIALIKTSGIGGQYEKYGNYAEMNTKGLEFSLGANIIDTEDFNLNANLTFSYSKNKITSIESSPRAIDLVLAEGAPSLNNPARGLYSYQFMGLTEHGFPQFLNEKGELTIGDIYFQESDPENLVGLVYEGAVDAPYQGGLDLSFGYKNWKLNMFFIGNFGNKVRLDPYYSSSYSDMSIMPKEMQNRWTLPGDERRTNIPKIVTPSDLQIYSGLVEAYNTYNYSTVRVAKGDFIRMKEVFVTYDVPQSFVESLRLKRVQLKLTASNLGLLYSDKKLNGQDPEFLRSGGVAMPTPRQFTFTLRVGF